MDLTKLFETQRKLDTEIERKHPAAPGEDRLAKRILALQVELGELANEWRGFKFWSKNQQPSRSIKTTDGANEHNAVEYFCGNCEERFKPEDKILIDLFGNISEECQACSEGNLYAFRHKNPLLEEYVDCLHFILSIGNSHAMQYGAFIPIYSGLKTYQPIKYETIPKQFNYLYLNIAYLMDCTCDCEIGNNSEIDDEYEQVFRLFIALGEMLGFTWEQIETAYMNKNQINHERQANGY